MTLKQEQQEAADSASDPLSALGAGLVSGLEGSGSWQQVSNYAAALCTSNSS
jgi:hypothetical protein